jgi:acetylglutamate kinase
VSQVPSIPIGYTSPFELHNLDNNRFAKTIQEQIQPRALTPASPILTLVEAINKANQVAIANAINKTQEEIDNGYWSSDSKQNKDTSQIGN